MSYDNYLSNSRKVSDISDFSVAMEQLISSKFILAEKNISAVLKTIADNKALFELFKEALVGYNYSVEFNKSKCVDRGRPKLNLPENQARKIAYVFCLLMQIDTGKMQLKDLLDNYFYLPRPNQSFAMFASEMLEPFKEITEYLYVNGIATLLKEEIGYSLRREANSILAEMKNVITSSGQIGTDTKRDLLIMLTAIENAITPNKADLIKALMLGFNYALAQTQIYEQMHDHVISLKSLLHTAEIL